MADDRAPPVERLTDDADLEAGGGAGSEAWRLDAGVEDEVVRGGGVAVGDLDDEPVAAWDGDRRGGEPHVVGDHVDGRRVPGRRPVVGGARPLSAGEAEARSNGEGRHGERN